MAKRSTTPKELSDALREAVERTVQASAERGRGRAQGALDDMVDRVRGAEASITRSRKAVAATIDDRLPASGDDVRELKAELRAIGRRLDAIEERLPQGRTRSAAKSSPTRSGSSAKGRSSAKSRSTAKSRPAGKSHSTAKSRSAKSGSAAKSRSAAKGRSSK